MIGKISWRRAPLTCGVLCCSLTTSVVILILHLKTRSPMTSHRELFVSLLCPSMSVNQLNGSLPNPGS